jgi:KDO2-lipid IV(A) lauroyltransferase
MLRKIRYTAEVIGLVVGLVFFRILPLDVASALGGLLGRIFGPFSRAHLTARRNLEHALPEIDDAKRSVILRDMWDNLGRVVAEYPHLSRPIMRKRITIEGGEYLEHFKQSKEAAIYISGHFANWEIVPLAAAIRGFPMVLIYRAANNPVADRIIRYLRAGHSISMHNKGLHGARQALKALKEGVPVAMLVDQKMNDGSPVPFFGRDAMTATAVAQMAIKLQVPLFLARVVRTDGAHFHVTLHEPLKCDPGADPIDVMAGINAQFERWIREHPAQWFWVHNRWNWR